MRILILDDDQTRHDTFARRYAGHDLTHVYTVAEAQAALIAGGFDLASFDHDLADFQMERQIDGSVQEREKTGYDVVMFLVHEVPSSRWPLEVIVHSWNAPRARQMVETMRDRGLAASYRPFVTN